MAPQSEGTDEELLSRVRVIETQALPERASAYLALHDELARRLEGGPSSEPR